MPHIHIGLAQAVVIYLSWLLIHILVQLAAIQIHQTRFGQALATFG